MEVVASQGGRNQIRLSGLDNGSKIEVIIKMDGVQCSDCLTYTANLDGAHKGEAIITLTSKQSTKEVIEV